jgi:hypothetical protein
VNSITAEFPLRDTTEWADYRESLPIPIRVGVCGGEALQYDASRRRFVWNGVPSAAIDVVSVGGQRVTRPEVRNAPDSSGKPVTFLEFSEPVPEGKIVTARGRGAIHPIGGGLLENPADVLWFLLSYLGGMDLPVGRLAAFRQQALDLPVGGSVESAQSLYAVARSICDSIGAICSPDMRGFAQLWPEFDGPAVATVVGDDVTVDSKAEHNTIITDLTILYAWEAGQPRGAVQYRTKRTPPTGQRKQTIDAPWIANKRVASLVCQRLLRARARVQYSIGVQGFRDDLRIGQAVELDHPQIPVTGTHPILERTLDIDEQGPVTSFSLRAPVGPAPTLVLVRNTNSSDPLPKIELNIDELDDEFEVEIVDDETGAIVPSAVCTLDGVVTRRADSAGVVRFPSRYATRGEHTISVVAEGLDPWTITLVFN